MPLMQAREVDKIRRLRKSGSHRGRVFAWAIPQSNTYFLNFGPSVRLYGSYFCISGGAVRKNKLHQRRSKAKRLNCREKSRIIPVRTGADPGESAQIKMLD
jgi:hypothetical protein